MMRLLWHIWKYGHSVEVNRGLTPLRGNPSKGWLYKCECGHRAVR